MQQEDLQLCLSFSCNYTYKIHKGVIFKWIPVSNETKCKRRMNLRRPVYEEIGGVPGQVKH